MPGKKVTFLDAKMNKDFYVENRRKLAVNLEDGDLMLFFSGESAVSYTHLDVYKRQTINCASPSCG